VRKGRLLGGKVDISKHSASEVFAFQDDFEKKGLCIIRTTGFYEFIPLEVVWQTRCTKITFKDRTQ
jgi:hypothetical protein